jgi:DNA replication protein
MEFRNLDDFLASGDTSVNRFLLHHYRETGMTNEEFLVYLQFTSLSVDTNVEPITEEIGKLLGRQPAEVFQTFENMRAKGLVTYQNQRDGSGRVTTRMDFTPLLHKVLSLPTNGTAGAAQSVVPSDATEESGSNVRADIFSMVEKEFGRPLTPIELEEIKNWFDVDHYQPDLIKLALQEAVLYQSLSLRYISTILATWQRKNYRTVQEVRSNQQNRTKYKQTQNTEGPAIPMDIDIVNTDWDKF